MKRMASTDPDALIHAVEVIQKGGVVVYPTDTAYGLGVDATNQEAVKKLYQLKERPNTQATHVVIADMDMATDYVHVTESARKVADALLPGPLTLILKALPVMESILLGPNRTLGIRVPDNVFAHSLVQECGVPITTPSANKTGGETPYVIEAVLGSFGEESEKIDLFVNEGQLPGGVSTLVDLTGNIVEIVREGVITREEIERVLR